MKYFVTISVPGKPTMTLSREAKNDRKLHSSLAKEFGEGVSFEWSTHRDPAPPRERYPMTDAEFEAEGRRIALEGMDLPDGAYFAMAEELGLDSY